MPRYERNESPSAMRRTDDLIVSLACRKCPEEVYAPWHPKVKILAGRFERAGWTFRHYRGWFCDHCSHRGGAA